MLQSYKITHPYFKKIKCYLFRENRIFYDLNDIARALKIINLEFIQDLDEKEYVIIFIGRKKFIGVPYNMVQEITLLSNEKERLNEFLRYLRSAGSKK
jgi:allophanate hydrolase subunit 1